MGATPWNLFLEMPYFSSIIFEYDIQSLGRMAVSQISPFCMAKIAACV